MNLIKVSKTGDAEPVSLENVIGYGDREASKTGS